MYVNFNILNQLGSPSLNSNTFANRPAAGQVGRLFISTDTLAIYRDNGTSWDQIGGGAGISGSGTAGQVTYWDGTSSVTGESAFTYNAATNALRVDGNISLNRSSDNWSPNNVFTVGNGSFTSDTGGTYLTFNAYYNVDWKYSQNGVASFYSQANGGHIWYNASSGTAGNNLNLALAMYLDDQENLGVSTAPDVWLSNYKVVQLPYSSSFYSRNDGTTVGLTSNAYLNTSSTWTRFATGTSARYEMANNTHAWYIAASGSGAITYTQAMTMFSTGNVAIGTSTDNGFLLNVNNDATINGVRVGRGNSSVANNAVLGNDAGGSVTNGGNNTFLGQGSGNRTTTGASHTYAGQASGYFCQGGSFNTCFGKEAGYTNASSSYNAFFGAYAGTLATAQNNSAFGTNSLRALTTGTNNTAIGFDAGRYAGSGTTNNATSNNSIYVGYQSRSSASGNTNEIVIGYNVVGIGSNTTTIGNASTGTTAIYGNLLLGTTTVDGAKLYVNGSTKLNGTIRVDSQLSATAGGASGQHLIINCDGTTYKIALLNN